MVNGQGKGWAKGRTAANDPRVARNAEAHRGATYQRHVDPKDDRRHRGSGVRTLALAWSDRMAYVAGLIATDGCLINTGRHIAFDSCDEQLIRTYLSCLGRSARYRRLRTRSGRLRYQALFSDVAFYRWLLQQGLSQRKSLTLGAVAVPDEYLAHFLRGLLDGDGTIANFTHTPTRASYPSYVYERLWVFFTSASRAHVEWLKSRIDGVYGVKGYIERRPPRPPSKEYFRLKYGKRDSIVLLRALYPNEGVPKLERKWRIWDDYVRRHKTRTDEVCAEGGT